MKTKKITIMLITVVFGILSLPFSASAVVDWTKDDANNPVLEMSGSGWDSIILERPCVIKDGSNYKMWYAGSNGTNFAIGYATSTNGTDWTKDAGNPVFEKSAGPAWDDKHVIFPWVIKDDSTYRMWYAGSNTAEEDNSIQIGYATSPDGTTWTRQNSGNPVITKDDDNDWDGEGVLDPVVIKDGTTYKMWYMGFNETQDTLGIGYAESTDGISWTKYDNSNTTTDPYANSDPVIETGPHGAWHQEEVFSPCVIKEDSIYRMWFGGEDEYGKERVGYAYSIDGINWRQYDGNPVIMPGGSGAFDEIDVADPMVLKDGTTYKMWYRGYDGSDSFGYATSSAYQGNQPAINYAGVASHNRSTGMQIMMYFIPEGPGPLDINELKLDGPSGFSYTFFDWDLNNWMGTQFIAISQPKDTVDGGTYTYTMKSNNGQTATKELNLISSTIPVPQDGSGAGQMDRAVNGDTSDYVYAGNSTPTFRWKPMTGYTSGYYYRVRVIDWKYNNSWWYISDLQEGTNTDGSGYLYAQVPGNMLKSNTPYHWSVEVMDTNNTWSAHNRAWSDWRHIYTGTKSGSADFLNASWGKAGLVSEHSFRNGDRACFWAFVQNLAPWDIDTTTSEFEFRVRDPSNNPFHYFDIVNDAFFSDPLPFMYYSSEQGLPDPGEYDFLVCDGSLNCASHIINLARDDSVPRVTKDEMHHENVVTRIDNAYLPYADPELFWKSKGPDLWHRVMIFDWHYRRLIWRSDYLNGVTAGSDMSAQVPQGTLKPNNPYRWWVEVYDSTKQNRTRSQWLSFMTGSASARRAFLPAIYLLLLLGD